MLRMQPSIESRLGLTVVESNKLRRKAGVWGIVGYGGLLGMGDCWACGIVGLVRFGDRTRGKENGKLYIIRSHVNKTLETAPTSGLPGRSSGSSNRIELRLLSFFSAWLGFLAARLQP